jgi:hypothetical protein
MHCLVQSNFISFYQVAYKIGLLGFTSNLAPRYHQQLALHDLHLSDLMLLEAGLCRKGLVKEFAQLCM